MERMTYDFAIGGNHCWQVKGADNLECREVCQRQEDKGCKDCPIAKAFDRLASYEDTGLDPEEIIELKDRMEGVGEVKRLTGRGCLFAHDAFERLKKIEDILGDEYDLDRLRELVEADREQRCFVFRFGFGSIVYRTWIHPRGNPTFITENKMDTLNDLLNAETWDNAYSTRADAQAALRREQE